MDFKKLLVIPIIFAFVATAFLAFIPQVEQPSLPTNTFSMKITSSAFIHEQSIPQKYSRTGENINPPLSIRDVPETAKSLVLIMHDPDVPKDLRPDGNFDHWIVFNIPPQTTEIAEGQNPSGTLGANTRGDLAYGGPNPPYGVHRYFFKLYALDSMLDVPAGANRVQVELAMKDHIFAQAELMGKYEKENN